MTFKGSFIRMIVLSFFVLAVTTVINGKPGVTSPEIVESESVEITPESFVIPPGAETSESSGYEAIHTAQAEIMVPRNHNVIVNGKETRKFVYGIRGLDIKWNCKDKLILNGKEIVISERVFIEYKPNGGLIVNDQPINGFEYLRGTGKSILKWTSEENEGNITQGMESAATTSSATGEATGEGTPTTEERYEEAQAEIVVPRNHNVVVNGKETRKFVYGIQGLDIKWICKDKLILNGKEIVLSRRVFIEYKPNGGLIVNDQPINGFEYLRGTGKSILKWTSEENEGNITQRDENEGDYTQAITPASFGMESAATGEGTPTTEETRLFCCNCWK